MPSFRHPPRNVRLLRVVRVLWGIAGLGVFSALPAFWLPPEVKYLGVGSFVAVLALWCAYSVVWWFARSERFDLARSLLFGSWVAYVACHLGMYHPGAGTAQFEVLFVGLENSLVAMMTMGLLALAGSRAAAGRWLFALLTAYAAGAALVSSRLHDPTSLRLWLTTTCMSLVVLGAGAFFAFLFAKDLEDAVTRGEELRAEVERALDVARDANAAKSQFLASMSHELRTPLTGIVGYVELLLDTTSVSPRELARDLEHIRGAALHLNGVIGDVLDLSKIEAGKLELERTEVDLQVLLGEVVATARPLTDRKHNELNLHTTRLPPTLATDPGRLRQVLLNLLSNAAKFTERGRIELLVEGTGHGVRFLVSDTGIGIPPEKLESIFLPFEQVDASTTRRYGGTGLGLAVSRQLLALMGGALQVRSHLGEGSTFEFTLEEV